MNCSHCGKAIRPSTDWWHLSDGRTTHQFCDLDCLRAWVGPDPDNFSDSYETYKHIKERQ